jgi:outer membrane protein OmpA-like peptidoglycan-associated protein
MRRYWKPRDKEEGKAARPQEKTSASRRSDLPHHEGSPWFTQLPKMLWQAGNRAINKLLGRRTIGKPLEAKTQAEMEQAFGADFSRVRLHDDPAAHAAADSLNAKAFTQGDDLYLGTEAASSDSLASKELIAHELAHIVQQRGARAIATGQISQPGDRFEQAAHKAAHQALQGQHAERSTLGVPPIIQRQERQEGFLEEQLRNLLNRALREGVAYDSEKGWKVGGVAVRDIQRGAEVFSRIAQGDVQGAIDIIRPPDPRERERLLEQARQLQRELEQLRPVEERQREQEQWEQMISETSKRLGSGIHRETVLGPLPPLKLPEPRFDLRSAGIQLGTTFHWILDKFRFESAALEPHHRRQLNDLANQVKSNSQAEIEIIGYADTTGPLAFNQKLSEQRANAVRDYLLSRGVEGSKIKSVSGRGEEEPLVPERAEADRARNRRVEIFFRTGITQRSESRFGLPPLRLRE